MSDLTPVGSLKNKEIKIFDNFFDDELHQKIFYRILNGNWIICGGSPNKPEVTWHNEDLRNDYFFKKELLDLINDKLNSNYSVKRLYANGQTALQCGSPHTDNDGDITFLYYPNLKWHHSFQGNLIFMKKTLDKSFEAKNHDMPSNLEPFDIISYKPNRAVLFPGNIWHYADAPSRFFNSIRISLAYKLLKPKFTNYS